MDAGCRQLRFQTLPGPTKGASTQLQLPFPPSSWQSSPRAACTGAGSSTSCPQGACCCPHSCREDSCRQVRASCCLSNHLTLILGTLPTCAASPSPVSYGGICPALLKMPLSAGAPPAWGIRQTRLCFALMVTFLPCFFPVSFPSIARGTRWQNAIIPALPPPHPPAGFCPPVNFALCP